MGLKIKTQTHDHPYLNHSNKTTIYFLLSAYEILGNDEPTRCNYDCMP